MDVYFSQIRNTIVDMNPCEHSANAGYDHSNGHIFLFENSDMLYAGIFFFSCYVSLNSRTTCC